MTAITFTERVASTVERMNFEQADSERFRWNVSEVAAGASVAEMRAHMRAKHGEVIRSRSPRADVVAMFVAATEASR